ncbi:MAG: hypothetical protein SV375_08610 [Thermodesulfobacteriota bacterium]|nr:hypothetical protein [Thermodesulfobacteriota bacterium]
MTIEKERIEAIKRDIDLAALIESKGIPLKKNGKGYKGLWGHPLKGPVSSL